jgi:hypothetical protein
VPQYAAPCRRCAAIGRSQEHALSIFLGLGFFFASQYRELQQS